MCERALIIAFLAFIIQDDCAVTAWAFPTSDIYGSPCTMEDGSQGTCIELPDCPMRVQQVMSGQRLSTAEGRCSFDGHVEVVCCPEGNSPVESKYKRPDAGESKTSGKTLRLPSQTANALTMSKPDDMDNPMDYMDRQSDGVDCQEYENEVNSKEDATELTMQILNGEDARVSEFPYMVALGYRNDRTSLTIEYNCGGTLISVNHVLTAAHCVSNINNYVPIEAKLGVINLNDNSYDAQRVPVGRVVVHPKYRRNMNYHDIAVIKLQKAVSVTRTVKPICYHTKAALSADATANQEIVASGWGVTSFENENNSVILQKTPGLRLIDRIECARSYSGDLYEKRLPRGIDESMVCVIDANATRRSDTCQGDSGGPLLLGANGSNRLIGVTSFGRSCGSSVPAVYTSVHYYADWISSVISK